MTRGDEMVKFYNENPSTTQRQVAEKFGVTQSAVAFHIRQARRKGEEVRRRKSQHGKHDLINDIYARTQNKTLTAQICGVTIDAVRWAIRHNDKKGNQ